MSEKDNFAVSLVKEACPICGKLMDGPIIMNSRLSVPLAEKVKSLHERCIGYAEKPCEECEKIIKEQDGFFIIGVDEEKTTDYHNPYRSGHLVAIKKSSKFYKHLDDKCKVTDAVFMDYRLMKEVGLISEESKEE